jgi:hypothetical protein
VDFDAEDLYRARCEKKARSRDLYDDQGGGAWVFDSHASTPIQWNDGTSDSSDDEYSERNVLFGEIKRSYPQAVLLDVPASRWQPGGYAGDGKSRKVEPLQLLRMVAGQSCTQLEAQASTSFGVTPRAIRSWCKGLIAEGLVEKRRSAADGRVWTMHQTLAGQGTARKRFEPPRLTWIRVGRKSRRTGVTVDESFRFMVARTIGSHPLGQEEHSSSAGCNRPPVTRRAICTMPCTKWSGRTRSYFGCFQPRTGGING